MNRYFEIGQELSFGEKNGIYVIREVIGRGSSCVVYLADHTNKSGNVTEHILKEYNPKRLNIIRDALGYLIAMNEADSKVFSEGLERFATGMQKQLELHRCDELKNYTSNIQSSYYENGTLYIDMTVTNGTAYQHVEEKSLYDLMRRMKVFTHVIGAYHSKGYLHLDIKPENIYVRPDNETCEDVLLFDFDSITAKSDIANAMLSYTQQWAAMEQLLPNRRNRICESTDLFAIGEIIFYKLTGRHSENTERSMLTEISFDYSSQIFENVNPKVIPLLNELFRKTLCNSVNKRYRSADELEAQLEKIISLSDPQKPYLKSTLPSRSAFFVGREKEVEEVHKKLSENDIVFLSGVGGIGKTELAQYYAHIYKDYYNTIIFAPYLNSMLLMISDDNIFPIYNFYRYPEEKIEKYYSRKIQKLRELCDEGTLIIVDNYDIEGMELNILSELGCKFLITTRMNLWETFPYSQICIDKITDPFEVFREYYKKSLSEKDMIYVNELIDAVDGHTLTVELLAKQMCAGRVSPCEMFSRMIKDGIGGSGREKICRQGNVSKKLSAYEHIRALFNMSELGENDKYILSSLALIPYSGISAEKFYEWCELDNYDDINELVRQGWIKYDAEKDYISVLSVLGDVVLNDAVFLGEKIPLLDNLYDFISQNMFKTSWIIDDNGRPAVYHDDDYDEYYDLLPSIIIGITQNICKLIGYKEQKCEYLKKTISLLNGEDSVRNCMAALNVIIKNDPNNLDTLYALYEILSCSYEELNDWKGMAKCKNYALNIAEKLWKDKKTKVAEEYYKFGYRLMKLGLSKEGAKEYILKALEYAESDCLPDKHQISLIYHALGDLNMHEDVEKSEWYYRIALINAAGYLKEISQEYRLNSDLFEALDNFTGIFGANDQIIMDDGRKNKIDMVLSTISLKIASEYLRGIFRLWKSEHDLFLSLQCLAKIFISYGQLLVDTGMIEEADLFFQMSYEIKTVNTHA